MDSADSEPIRLWFGELPESKPNRPRIRAESQRIDTNQFWESRMPTRIVIRIKRIRPECRRMWPECPDYGRIEPKCDPNVDPHRDEYPESHDYAHRIVEIGPKNRPNGARFWSEYLPILCGVDAENIILLNYNICISLLGEISLNWFFILLRS